MALRGGLLTSHVAPLTAFALVMAFAAALALSGLISRRAGEATILLAAAAFMIQRLASHWRISRARSDGRAAIGRLQSAAALKATFGDEALSFDMDGRILNLLYADCEQAEDAGGLIYVWPRNGAPIVAPTRVMTDAEETARLLSHLSARIGKERRAVSAG
jgi:hypothetical protein